MQKVKEIAELFAKLQLVNDFIEQINAYAEKLANDKCAVQLRLQIVDVTEAENEKSKVLYKDGSLIKEPYPGYISKEDLPLWQQMLLHGGIVGFFNAKKDSKDGVSFMQKVDEIASLQILGIMLNAKERERNILLRELEGHNIYITKSSYGKTKTSTD
jgi:hypothetical protein